MTKTISVCYFLTLDCDFLRWIDPETVLKFLHARYFQAVVLVELVALKSLATRITLRFIRPQIRCLEIPPRSQSSGCGALPLVAFKSFFGLFGIALPTFSFQIA